MDSHQADLIAQFSSITGANPSMAQSALEATNWNLEQSMALYYDEQANAPGGDADEGIEEAAASSSSQPATTNPATTAAGSSNVHGKQQGRPKQMTFRDLQRGDEDDDEDEDEKGQDMFAGGEKSGLAVQNPDAAGPSDHFRNIMNQARSNRARPPAQGAHEDDDTPQQPRTNNFAGRAQTLGGDDVESQVLGDPTADARQSRPRRETVSRTLHLWRDGVSLDDGDLYRFDDPNNAHIISQINQGRVPRELLDVEYDQEVDLTLEPHKDEDYKQPKKKYKPFGGAGQRLGSPTPGIASSSASASAPSTTLTSASSSAAASTPTSAIPVDESQPTLQMQIRLGDGTRLSSRFNSTHTIGDVYDFVNRASPASLQRPYVLQTTFPTTEYSDQARVLGEISDFKRGGVLVQKFK